MASARASGASLAASSSGSTDRGGAEGSPTSFKASIAARTASSKAPSVAGEFLAVPSSFGTGEESSPTETGPSSG
ncbi:hypothetical protein PR002_g20347 [Phytophthora rubi]|uniref:Uncharacterized protein n=1 Tax=Phytophthora rubi TaxID=129364 RepID=A0A6A3JEB5_9STRA|nr:hypothetical protein PR002_g20347 [Phytophthora rubi]